MNILEVHNLTKSFNEHIAVNDISFTVKKGSFFSFLGPNGAGKSTTIKMIITLLKPDNGTILFEGDANLDTIRKSIGVVFQDNVLDDKLTVKENLWIRGAFYLDRQALETRYRFLQQALELEPIENQIFATLSGGQKRRCEIARALLSKPKLLLLDEPTTGLDPETRHSVWKMLNQLRKEENITLFLTTHYMEEAAQSDYIVIIDKGNILDEGTPIQLKKKYSQDNLYIIPKDSVAFEKRIQSLNYMYSIDKKRYIFPVESTDSLLKMIANLSDLIDQIEIIKGTMDDVFIQVIGGNHV